MKRGGHCDNFISTIFTTIISAIFRAASILSAPELEKNTSPLLELSDSNLDNLVLNSCICDPDR